MQTYKPSGYFPFTDLSQRELHCTQIDLILINNEAIPQMSLWFINLLIVIFIQIMSLIKEETHYILSSLSFPIISEAKMLNQKCKQITNDKIFISINFLSKIINQLNKPYLIYTNTYLRNPSLKMIQDNIKAQAYLSVVGEYYIEIIQPSQHKIIFKMTSTTSGKQFLEEFTMEKLPVAGMELLFAEISDLTDMLIQCLENNNVEVDANAKITWKWKHVMQQQSKDKSKKLKQVQRIFSTQIRQVRWNQKDAQKMIFALRKQYTELLVNNYKNKKEKKVSRINQNNENIEKSFITVVNNQNYRSSINQAIQNQNDQEKESFIKQKSIKEEENIYSLQVYFINKVEFYQDLIEDKQYEIKNYETNIMKLKQLAKQLIQRDEKQKAKVQVDKMVRLKKQKQYLEFFSKAAYQSKKQWNEVLILSKIEQIDVQKIVELKSLLLKKEEQTIRFYTLSKIALYDALVTEMKIRNQLMEDKNKNDQRQLVEGLLNDL